MDRETEGKVLGRAWDPREMEFEGDHPVVYVGAGSHANYYTPDPHAPDKGFVPGDVVVGGRSGRPWADPEPLEQPWCTAFKGRWGAYQWSRRGDRLVSTPGGPPTGPKFGRDGRVRAKWERPAEYAGLV